MLYEIDARLQTNESGVVIAEGDTNARIARLDEWLRTPNGSVYGLPSWGIRWRSSNTNPSVLIRHTLLKWRLKRE